MAEVLSQSQIDALLNAARNGEMDLAAKAESSSEKNTVNMISTAQGSSPKTGLKCSAESLKIIPGSSTPESMDCCIPLVR